jgi:hypothetical protein
MTSRFSPEHVYRDSADTTDANATIVEVARLE